MALPGRTARRSSGGWPTSTGSHGDLIEPALEDEPEGEGIAELLDEAEDIVNAAGPASWPRSRPRTATPAVRRGIKGWFRRKR